MNRFTPALIALALALTAGAANAQQPGTYVPNYAGPVVSPYLNLLHGGNPAINYYGIVRPQIQQNEQLQALQYGLARTAADVTAVTASTTAPGVLPDTGHTAGFMTYMRYFNTVNARGH